MNRVLAFTTVAVWLLAGCGDISDHTTPESAEDIRQALNETNGGQGMADENAAFGLVDLTDETLDPNEIAPPDAPDQLARLVRAEAGLADGDLTGINAPACAHGLLGGKWLEVGKGYGVWRGRWASANGQVKGHLKGIWGRTRDGAQRFFGKYISRAGEFRGLIKGHYANGSFAGHYIDRSGIKGVLHGAYGEVRAHCGTDDNEIDVRVARTDDTSGEPSTPDGRCAPDKGFFVGKWRELCRTNRCQRNSDCDATDFCRLADGACMLECKVAGDALNSEAGKGTCLIQGVCQPRPEMCIAMEAPVCGCDGNTYGNDCRASAAGVSIAHKGACGQTNPCGGNADCNQKLCGGQVCGPNEWCCGPAECGWCAPNGTLPPCLAECSSL